LSEYADVCVQMFGISCKKLKEAEDKLNVKDSGSLAVKNKSDITLTKYDQNSVLPEVQMEQQENDKEELLAFARVFSGSLKPG